MRNWRVLTAIAAVVLAALAGVLVWKYADDAKKKAEEPFTQVDVLVAAKRIPGGTTFTSALDNELMRRERRVQGDLPDSAILGAATDQQLKNAYKDLVAGHDIVIGQTIVQEDFVTQGQIISGVSGSLESDNDARAKNGQARNLQAVTVTFDDEHAVGGFLNPGDRVNVLVHMAVDDDHFISTEHVKLTAFLLPGLKVLAVGATTAAPQQSTASDGTTPTTQATQSRGLITFEVTPRQAEQLIHAREVGTLWLSLNPPSWKPGDFTTPEEVVEVLNLFDQPLPRVEEGLNILRSRNPG